MNRRRLAELFRMQSEIAAEIAVALLEEEPANDPQPVRRPRRTGRVLAPSVQPSELDMARADRMLDDLGYRRR